MKSTKSTAAVLLLAACSSASAGQRVRPPVVASSGRGSLVVAVEALRNERGLVGVAVFCGPAGFPGETGMACARARVRITGRTATVRFADLPAGAFAVAVIHDEDADGKLGTSWVGVPVEGYGASRGARRRFGAPRWDDARLQLADGQEQRVPVEVGY